MIKVGAHFNLKRSQAPTKHVSKELNLPASQAQEVEVEDDAAPPPKPSVETVGKESFSSQFPAIFLGIISIDYHAYEPQSPTPVFL